MEVCHLSFVGALFGLECVVGLGEALLSLDSNLYIDTVHVGAHGAGGYAGFLADAGHVEAPGESLKNLGLSGREAVGLGEEGGFVRVRMDIDLLCCIGLEFVRDAVPRKCNAHATGDGETQCRQGHGDALTLVEGEG